MQASAMGADLSSRCLTGGAAALRCRSASSSTAQARACAPRPGVAHAALSVEAPKTETGDIREQAHRRGVLVCYSALVRQSLAGLLHSAQAGRAKA